MRYIAQKTSSIIPEQFPQFYKEDGALFVEFTKAYYEFLDNQNTRNFTEIVDVDSTFTNFLLYFKRKYLKDLPFVNYSTDDLRFIIKHIADLYTRKGTEEALQLLFKMFFKEEVEVFYPSTSVLKISDSLYASTKFIEFKSVNKVQNFPLKKGDVIRGDISGAYAFLDDIVFYNINGSITPIGYISNTYGKFTSDDGLQVERDGTSFYAGPLIYGSINATEVLRENSRPDNKVGDRLDLISSGFGVSATAIVEEVSEKPSGIIEWEVTEPGFGLSTTKEENEIYVSTQALVLAGEEGDYNIEPFDTIQADNTLIFSENDENPLADAESNRLFAGFGTVIAYEHPILYIQTTPEDVIIPREGAFVTIGFDQIGIGSFVPFPDAGAATASVTKANGFTFNVQVNSLAEYNASAQFELATYDNQESLKVITDIIGDHAGIRLDASDYGMSGPGQENLNTTLRDAFTPEEYEIGSIRRIRILDTGVDYKNDVRTILRFPPIQAFDFRDIGLIFNRSDFIITEGDILEQEILIEDLDYDEYYFSDEWTVTLGNPAGFKPYTARARYLRRKGNVYYFRPLTFWQPRKGPLTVRGRQLEIDFVVEDLSSDPAGANSIINGFSELLTGQIRRIRVLQSGFKYRNNEKVELRNQQTGNQVAYAQLTVGGQGETDGQWVTTTSHLNNPNKFIHDNNYYQEYSYDISSILNPDVYEKAVKDITHVAGTKMFSSPLINTNNAVNPKVDVGIEAYSFVQIPLRTESDPVDFLTTEHGVIYTSVTQALLMESAGNQASPELHAIFMTDIGDGTTLANFDNSSLPFPDESNTIGDVSLFVDYVTQGTSGNEAADAKIALLLQTLNEQQTVLGSDYSFTDGPDTFNLYGTAVSGEVLDAVIVNFEDTTGLTVPYADLSIPIYGPDRSLDTTDEIYLTMDNEALTFDRE